MIRISRAAAAVSVLAAAVLFAGCTATPGAQAPTSAPAPSDSSAVVDDDDYADIEATLVDDGRLFAVVTWGSSSCVPIVDTVTAEGQTVSVTLVESDPNAACTADMAQRASIGGLPEGVDPTKEITLNVTYGDIVDDVELDGDPAFTGTPGTSTDYVPTAGWFDDDALVLVTWGSSTCPPVVEGLEGAGATGTVTFATGDDQPCTMDMVPRATLLTFADDQIDDDGFTLTLVGGNLDGTVTVRG